MLPNQEEYAAIRDGGKPLADAIAWSGMSDELLEVLATLFQVLEASGWLPDQ